MSHAAQKEADDKNITKNAYLANFRLKSNFQCVFSKMGPFSGKLSKISISLLIATVPSYLHTVTKKQIKWLHAGKQ